MTGSDLDGRVAVVTGAASGIGAAVAARLAADGAHVVVNDRDGGRAEAAAGDLRVAGFSATDVAGDVSSPNDVARVVSTAVDTFGRLDIMVNNAGIEGDAALRKLDVERWNTVLAVNLTGVMLGTQAASAVMVSQKFGRVVNIASRAWLGWWGQSNYAASKGGVVSLTRASAVELARRGITVNCVAPGLIDSPMLQALEPEARAKLMTAQPTGSLGQPADVAHLVRFLVDERARSITGQTLYACGGKSLFAMPPAR